MIFQISTVICNEMEWISSLLCRTIKRQAFRSAPLCGVLQDFRAYLNEGVDNSNVRTGIEHFVEIGLSVDKFQLVELLIVLGEKTTLAHSQKGCGRVTGLLKD